LIAADLVSGRQAGTWTNSAPRFSSMNLDQIWRHL
jgi:hypothetical protein